MLDASGVWSVSYRATANALDGNVDTEEIATLVLSKDGSISGNDPFGGKYAGTYSVEGTKFKASVVVDKTYDEAITIFAGADFPLHVDLEANYTSPDFFAANCSVNGEQVLLVNCRRIADPIS